MKYCIVFLMTLIAVLHVAFAADCMYRGRRIKVGQKSRPIGECIELECRPPGRISAINCASSLPPRGCRNTPEDLRKAYPQCCPRVVCR